jgi:hypothetical protein
MTPTQPVSPNRWGFKECPCCGQRHRRCTVLCEPCRRGGRKAPKKPCASCGRDFDPPPGRPGRLAVCEPCRKPSCPSCGRPTSRPNSCARCIGREVGVILPKGPPAPTAVPPGAAKVNVMAARYAAGLELFHKNDAR